jgi:hypothetical protein
MPPKTACKAREYNRVYHLARYRRLRKELLSQLGGKCAAPGCASVLDLQIDHIDRATKSFNLSDHWGKPRAAIQAELAKCQLLCRACHTKKTNSELSKGHGCWGMYRNRKCRCVECRAFVSAWMKAHYRKLAERGIPRNRKPTRST